MLPHLAPASLAFARLLAESHAHWKGEPLVPGQAGLSDAALAQALYALKFPVVAHGTEADPVFCYANAAALALWEMEWQAFTRLPSRLSAADEADVQGDRNRLLAAALQRGFVDDYAGTRVSATGKRFEIRNTTLWNVVDAEGRRLGQAAVVRGYSQVAILNCKFVKK